jgi:hypothetical protein
MLASPTVPEASVSRGLQGGMTRAGERLNDALEAACQHDIAKTHMLPVVSSDALRDVGFRLTPMRNISLNRLAMAGKREEDRPAGDEERLAAPAAAQQRLPFKASQQAA